ncbi:YlaI family protein [Candidatus Pseudothioglobus singularis]|nr:YlaI family protein [Candidatus Pseudothioglobus singularis]
MKVKCTICDKIDDLDHDSFQAKRLRNRMNSMYLCKECYDRITEKTRQRLKSGKFRLYREKKKPGPF